VTASIAGHLKLGNLCWIYDDNKITIEGSTSLTFSENVRGRFESYGWNVLEVDDANDLDALRDALRAFQQPSDSPTLVIVRSVIAWGAPNKANTADAHGAPLGEEEVRLAKQNYGWPEEEKFLVPDEVRTLFAEGIGRRGKELSDAWYAKWEQYKEAYPELAEQLHQMIHHKLPDGWDAEIPEFPADAKGLASRNASGKVLNAVARRVPWLVGGSADLAPSNKTLLSFDGAKSFSAETRSGRNFHYGIREHAMAGISNGLALCGLRPFAGTFFVFSDYLRPSLRLSAMMGLPVIYIFTHDSIGVGEDGPTHQPVEQLASLRAVPNLVVFRPADANEVAAGYRVALRCTNRPVALVLTRQNLPTLDRQQLAPAAEAEKGGYVLADGQSAPQVILIASGSEVALCVEAYRQLAAEGIAARVVSLPSWELFDEQPEEYRNAVLPPEVPCRIGVEAGVQLGWEKYLGPQGRFIGMNSFGASAPYKQLYEHFGITAKRIVAEAKSLLGK